MAFDKLKSTFFINREVTCIRSHGIVPVKLRNRVKFKFKPSFLKSLNQDSEILLADSQPRQSSSTVCLGDRYHTNPSFLLFFPNLIFTNQTHIHHNLQLIKPKQKNLQGLLTSIKTDPIHTTDSEGLLKKNMNKGRLGDKIPSWPLNSY